MKKYLLSMLAVFCLVFAIGNAQVSAQHFDYDEAYQILQGAWIADSTTRKDNPPVYLVWKSRDGSECNIVNGQGYTDPTGNSRIYFDHKGMQACIDVTYYSDQDTYYAKMYEYVNGKWMVMYNCLVKQ